MRVVTVMNQKGGVGKTTTTLNLASALAGLGERILVIDFDPQGQAGLAFGANESMPGIAAVLLDGTPIAACGQQIRENIFLVCAGSRLEGLENASGGAERGYRLRNAIADWRNSDYAFVDCAPSAGVLGMNALLASTELLIPVAADYLALHGLARLAGVLKGIERHTRRVRPKRLLLTRFQTRRRLAQEVEQKLHQYFPTELLKTRIRESVALAESPSFGQSIFEYRPRSVGASDYRALAEEFRVAA